MKNLISLALLLAVAISCNGQAPPRALPPRPSNPGSAAPSAPSSPPVRPAPPPRNQTPSQTPSRPAPQAPTRPAPAPPARPPSVQNPQQGPNRGTPSGPSAPGPSAPQNGPSAPGPSAPGPSAPGPSAPGPSAPGPSAPGPSAPGPNAPAPSPTQRPGDNSPPNANAPVPTELPQRPDGNNFPTLPNIAPIPPVHFPPTNDMPHMPPVNSPQMPSFPSNPSNPRVGEGRPDARCPQFADPRSPVHLPHESNCANFYKCDHGMAFEYRCPNGQHWNAHRNYCDFPSTAGCQAGVITRPQPQPLPQAPLPPTNNWIQNQPLPPTNNWNQNQPRNNPHPGYEHPIVIPMAPRT